MSAERARGEAAPADDGLAAEMLAMLEIRESDALPGWVAERLRTGHPGARSRVLRVYPAKAARIKGVESYEAFSVAEGGRGDGTPVPVGMDAPLIDAVRGRRALLADAAETGSRWLATFEAGGEVRYVVEVRGAANAPGPAARAEALVAVARKYFERLVDGETDPLTRLANRRLFQAHVDAGIKRWTATGRAYFFAMLDLDHFKRINDEMGHLYGDEILVHFANLMRRTFRSGDQLYRFGGEEFVLIYGVDPPEHGGQGTLERFRAAVERYRFPGVGQVTVSIGFARIADATTPAAVLIDRADEALYHAKSHGRNQVCGWESLLARGLAKARPAAPDVTLF